MSTVQKINRLLYGVDFPNSEIISRLYDYKMLDVPLTQNFVIWKIWVKTTLALLQSDVSIFYYRSLLHSFRGVSIKPIFGLTRPNVSWDSWRDISLISPYPKIFFRHLTWPAIIFLRAMTWSVLTHFWSSTCDPTWKCFLFFVPIRKLPQCHV